MVAIAERRTRAAQMADRGDITNYCRLGVAEVDLGVLPDKTEELLIVRESYEEGRLGSAMEHAAASQQHGPGRSRQAHVTGEGRGGE